MPPNTGALRRIVIQDLSFRRDDGEALFSDVRFAFAPRRYGLVGENGSGKTTLLRLIAGKLSADSGVVTTSGTVAFLSQHRSHADGRLSGGEARRAELQALLTMEPDWLLLDEPTNHLDCEGREALHRLIDDWHGGLIVASHDRELLEHVDEIVEIRQGALQRYGGAYELYASERARHDEAARRALQGAQATLAHERRDLAEALQRTQRRNAAGKRSAPNGGIPKIFLGGREQQAQVTASKSKTLHADRVQQAAQTVEAMRSRVRESAELFFDAQLTHVPAGRVIVEIDHFNITFSDGTPLWEHGFRWALSGPQRVSVLGENGRGKTLLLREVARSSRVPVAYLDQELSLLSGFQTAADVMRAFADHIPEHERRSRLARAGFAQERGTARIAPLSGGERMRLALCAVLSQHPVPQLLILDEPTNDLDLRSLEELANALRAFRGALLVVSHDAAFLEQAEVSDGISPPRRFLGTNSRRESKA